jgi:hypothetical protein
MSATHLAFGGSAVNSWFSTFLATGSVCLLSVVAGPAGAVCTYPGGPVDESTVPHVARHSGHPVHAVRRGCMGYYTAGHFRHAADKSSGSTARLLAADD